MVKDLTAIHLSNGLIFADLPYDFDNTVGTFINSSHIFLAGVSDKYEEAYLVDVDSWEFTRMPDMSWGRIYYACGMVENKVRILDYCNIFPFIKT